MCWSNRNARGRVIPFWRHTHREVEIEHLERVTKKAAGRLEADATAVEAFLSN
jgi:hypothetical protein